MLAAAPPREKQGLDLFRFALELISRGDEKISGELEAYLRQVLEQANALAQDPVTIRGPFIPEAIHLALEMKKREVLKERVHELAAEGELKPDAAGRLRSAVEEVVVQRY